MDFDSKKSGKVKIEYCGSGGYESQLKRAQLLIWMAYPKAEVEVSSMSRGPGCFEIFANGKSVHSKLGGDGDLDDSTINAMMVRLRGVIEGKKIAQ